MMKPVLILLTGLPCSGKSTIGAELSRRLRVPIFSRDDFREPMFDAFGSSHEKAFNDKVGFVANEDLFLVIHRHLQVAHPVMIENIFHPHIYDSIFKRMLGEIDFFTVQVNLRTDAKVLEQRYRKRDADGQKHPGHWNFDDYPYKHLFEIGGIEPLQLPGQVIKIDTTDLDKINYDGLASQILNLEGDKEEATR